MLALPSSGLHSNGYSLARRALLDPAHAGLALDDQLAGTDRTIGEALLTPTRIYVKALLALRDLDGAPLHGAAHMTGGGLIENPPRAFGDHLGVELEIGKVARPAIMDRIAAVGVSEDEMRRTFNMGVGFAMVVAADRSAALLEALDAAGEQALLIGEVTDQEGVSFS